MNNGIITKQDYEREIHSTIFHCQECYSDKFQNLYNDDVFHQWSRQFEYPYVFRALENRITQFSHVLDAGSGLTFFPFYLKYKYPNVNIHCCDLDVALADMYDNINLKINEKVTFYNSDLRELETWFYDCIYCISVLEHTDNYEQILKNFHNLLLDDGLLVLTFDVSLDDTAAIPLAKLDSLLELISNYFVNVHDTQILDYNQFVTTKYINENNYGIMPWKYSFKDKFMRKNKIPNLTFYCGVYRKINMLE